MYWIFKNVSPWCILNTNYETIAFIPVTFLLKVTSTKYNSTEIIYDFEIFFTINDKIFDYYNSDYCTVCHERSVSDERNAHLSWKFNKCGPCLALIAFPGVQSYEPRVRISAYVAINFEYEWMHQEWWMQRRVENVHEYDHHPNRWHRGWQCTRKYSIFVFAHANVLLIVISLCK